MIQTITISNFFSIREPLEVSFEASKDKHYGEDWIVQIGNVKLLKALFLYGANGSGKTNILIALDFLRSVILSVPTNIDMGFRYLPFAFDSEYQANPTDFDVKFFIEDQRYRYQISMRPDMILSEELSQYQKANQCRRVFKREYSFEKERSIVTFGPWLKLSSKDKQTIEEATTRNTSVIAAYTTRNLSCEILNVVRNYFKHQFFKIYDFSNGDQEVARALKDDPKLKTILIELLKSFNSNIVDVSIEEVSRPVPEEARQFLLQINQSKEEREAIENFKAITKMTSHYIHKTPFGEFTLEDSLQSEGTRSFIRQLVLFYKGIKGNRLIALDEFGSGMQAKTQHLLLDFFLKFSKRSQLIIATQSLGLLDYPTMRRDAIDIVSKDEIGQSKIDSETIRGIHWNVKLRKAYIDGKFKSIDPNEPEINLDVERLKFESLIFDEA